MAGLTSEILLKINTDTKGVEAQLKGLEDKLGNVGKNVNPDTFKSLKQQIREAAIEAQNLGQQFGLNSKQFTEAGKKVAELKDQFEDANKVIKGFNPDNKLQGLVGIASGAATAIQGVAGAFTLIGVNAETANVAIAKLQGVMALTNAISQIDNIKNSFTSLKGVIGELGKGDIWGAVIAGIVGVGTALYAMNQMSKETNVIYNETQRIISESAGEYVKAATEVDKLRQNIQLAKDGFLDKEVVLKQYNTTIGQTVGHAKDLNEAELILEKNADAYLKMMLNKAAANLALEDAAKKAFEAEKTRQQKAADFQTIGSNASTFSSGSSAPGFVPSLSNPLEGVEARQKAAQKAQEETAKGFDAEAENLKKIANKFNEDVKKIAKEFKFNLNDDSGTGGSVKDKLTKQLSIAASDNIKTVDLNSLTVDVKEVKTSAAFQQMVSDRIKKDIDNNNAIIQATLGLKSNADSSAQADLLQYQRENPNDIDGIAKQKILRENAAYDLRKELAKNKNGELQVIEQEHQDRLLQIEKEAADAKIKIAETEKDEKLAFIDAIGFGTEALGELVGRDTVAGKGLAIASAAINTYAAITKTLATYGGTPVGIAQAIATGVFGLVQVQKIIDTPVPTRNGGNRSSGAISVSKPSAPSLNTTILNTPLQPQDVRVTNPTNQGVIAAYITQDSLRTNEEKQNFLNKLRTI